MRTVFITARPREPASWVAVDRFSGAPLLKLYHYEQLKGVCSRPGWAIASDAETTAQRPKRMESRPAAAAMLTCGQQRACPPISLVDSWS